MNHAANFIPIFTATCYRGNNNRPNNKAPAAWNAKVLLRERKREGVKKRGSSSRAGVVAHVRQQQLTVWGREGGEEKRARGREVST